MPEEINLHFSNEVTIENAGKVYLEVHNRLQTQYARLEKIKTMFEEEASQLDAKYADISYELRIFLERCVEAFNNLNPDIVGVEKVREQILNSLNNQLKHTQTMKDLFDLNPDSVKNYVNMLKTTRPLHPNYGDVIIAAQYHAQAEKLAEQRGIKNTHKPSYPMNAFNSAVEAVKYGYDIVVIVGPEGFAYEPYFLELGLETVAVNIPESKADGVRTLIELDNLSILKGKKVLVVEDDLRTGATLQKLLERISEVKPVELGLYLGQPNRFQIMENAPVEFSQIHVAEQSNGEKSQQKLIDYFLKKKGEVIFRHPERVKNIVAKDV